MHWGYTGRKTRVLSALCADNCHIRAGLIGMQNTHGLLYVEKLIRRPQGYEGAWHEIGHRRYLAEEVHHYLPGFTACSISHWSFSDGITKCAESPCSI